MFSPGVRHRWRLLQTQANNQIAFACYRRDEIDGLYHAHALQVLTLEDAHITEMHMFLVPPMFPRFGLAMVLMP